MFLVKKKKTKVIKPRIYCYIFEKPKFIKETARLKFHEITGYTHFDYKTVQDIILSQIEQFGYMEETATDYRFIMEDKKNFRALSSRFIENGVKVLEGI